MARTALFVVVVAAFIPLVDTYSVPFRVTSATVPAWFERDAPHLAPGTAVLTIPFAYGVASRPMAWQAETHDDFDLIGGFAFVPGADGVHDEMMSPLGGAVGALNVLSADPGSVTIAQQETIRAAMVRWRPVVVVVTAGAPPGAARAVTDMLGLSPTWSGGVWVWSVGRTTRLGSLVALRRGG